MRVTVVGTGYVGTVTGACLAFLGHCVTCVDTDQSKVDRLRRGDPVIFEPGLEQLLALAIKSGGIDFETDITQPARESDSIFIAVGTPPLPSGESNLSYLETAARGIGAAMDSSRYRVVINKSTVPVGSGNLVGVLSGKVFRILKGIAKLIFSVASNLEFLREGSAIHDSLYPDRIVIGHGRLPSSQFASRTLQAARPTSSSLVALFCAAPRPLSQAARRWLPPV